MTASFRARFSGAGRLAQRTERPERRGEAAAASRGVWIIGDRGEPGFHGECRRREFNAGFDPSNVLTMKGKKSALPAIIASPLILWRLRWLLIGKP